MHHNLFTKKAYKQKIKHKLERLMLYFNLPDLAPMSRFTSPRYI